MSNPLSAVIITYNAASQLEDCLKSVRFADQVVILDSGSNDDTPEIARRAGALFLQRDWAGYGPQKQRAVAAASNDWVLCIDADERVSPELAQSIRQELLGPAYGAYRFPRCNRFMGRWLRHGEGYPDMCLRLFDRRQARWSDDVVHETVLADCEVGKLKGDLLHESQTTLHDYLAKQNRYTTLQAEKLFAAGRSPSSMKMLLNPAYRFIKFYLLRLGFLDGIPGLVHILIGCQNTFLKYAKLRAMHDERGPGS